MTGVNYSEIPVPLQGRPRVVQVYREVAGPHPNLLRESSFYGNNGLLLKRATFRRDGSLSYRYSYEYGKDGALNSTIISDESGELVQSIDIEQLADGREQQSYFDGTTTRIEITSTVRDESKGTVTTECVDAEGNLLVQLVVFNRPDGQPVKARVKLAGSPDEIEYEFDGGEPPMLTAVRLEGVGPVFDAASLLNMGGEEQIESRDAQGNWTRKTVRKKDDTGQVNSIETLVRTITYY